MAGLKGYVSNIPAGVMGTDEVIASYHELWHVEQSFRMTRARPENPPDLPPHPRRDQGVGGRVGAGAVTPRPAPSDPTATGAARLQPAPTTRSGWGHPPGRLGRRPRSASAAGVGAVSRAQAPAPSSSSFMKLLLQYRMNFSASPAASTTSSVNWRSLTPAARHQIP